MQLLLFSLAGVIGFLMESTAQTSEFVKPWEFYGSKFELLS